MNKKRIKVGMVSLGCPKNLVDSEAMLGLIDEEGFQITPDADEAEIIVINTCGFIGDAKKESIDAILEMADKKQGNCRFLIVTGCLSERYADSFERELPEVDAVLGTGDYINIVDVIKSLLDGKKGSDGGVVFRRGNILEYSVAERIAHLGCSRIITTGSGYTYVKIAEGCDNHCSYCIIPTLRGSYASREISDIVREISVITADKPKEIVIVAQDITRYGKDIYGEFRICELIEEISELKNVKWIRLLYCYPDLIDAKLIQAIKQNEKLVKYLDIPIQHASSKILEAMGRRYDEKQLRELITWLRFEIPEIVLRTTMITGFPGETEDDYERLKAFVADCKFERLGVFPYSMEEGTPAAAMGNKVAARIAAKRRSEILRLQQGISRKKEQDRIGRVYEAVINTTAIKHRYGAEHMYMAEHRPGAEHLPGAEHRPGAEHISGAEHMYMAEHRYGARTYAEAPEIDGTIRIWSDKEVADGEFVSVRITGADRYGLTGVIDGGALTDMD